MTNLAELLAASAMAMIVLHLGHIAYCSWLCASPAHRADRRAHAASRMALAVYGLFALHSIEIWLKALLYRHLGVLSETKSALYSLTDLCDDLLGRAAASQGLAGHRRRGANGMSLLGWPRTFCVAIIARIWGLERMRASEPA